MKWLIFTASLEAPLHAGRSTGCAWTKGDGVEFAVATLEQTVELSSCSTEEKSNSLPDSGTCSCLTTATVRLERGTGMRRTMRLGLGLRRCGLLG